MIEDKLLIWKFNRGDKRVLHRIYDKYKDGLVTLAAALSMDKSLSEDAVQDVFVGFINSGGKFRLTGSLKGYLSTCVANSVRNRNRSIRRSEVVELEEAEPYLPSSTSRPEQGAIFGEENQRLGWALGLLPYEQREVVVLHIYNGLKFRAIAGIQNVSINTVQGRWRYALDRLRALLDGQVTGYAEREFDKID